MKIQYVSKYISLSEEGLVPKLSCPQDQGLLLSNQTLEDEVYLYCLSCTYRRTIGGAAYREICKALLKAGVIE